MPKKQSANKTRSEKAIMPHLRDLAGIPLNEWKSADLKKFRQVIENELVEWQKMQGAVEYEMNIRGLKF
jgi:hypothetical protein